MNLGHIRRGPLNSCRSVVTLAIMDEVNTQDVIGIIQA